VDGWRGRFYQGSWGIALITIPLEKAAGAGIFGDAGKELLDIKNNLEKRRKGAIGPIERTWNRNPVAKIRTTDANGTSL